MEPLAVLKYVLLFGTAPIWFPFAKALWEEFLKDMRLDGGLYGAIPTPVQREEIARKIEREFPSQVHEPKSSYRKGAAAAIARQAAREEAEAKSSGRPQSGPKAGPQSGSTAGRFRR